MFSKRSAILTIFGGERPVEPALTQPLSVAERVLLVITLSFAILLGSWVFSQFDSGFWVRMVAFSAAMFSLSLLLLGQKAIQMIRGSLSPASALTIGVVSAIAFYAIAFAGFRIVVALFPDSAKSATSVYAAGNEVPPFLVTLALLAIAVTEEFYWRGWATPASVRLFLTSRRGSVLPGLLLVAAIYGLLHIFARNLLLVLIAFVAALYWGALYLRFRSLLLTITSHFFWDLLIFQIFPLIHR